MIMGLQFLFNRIKVLIVRTLMGKVLINEGACREECMGLVSDVYTMPESGMTSGIGDTGSASKPNCSGRPHISVCRHLQCSN
jgi:hypothetical protein